MATTYGNNLKISVYGGSHDEEIGVKASGLPEDETFDLDRLLAFMKRRAPGNARFATARKEPDTPVFVSGVTDGHSLDGSEFHAVIKNTNAHSSDYKNLSDIPRPSHADYPARVKYGEGVDLRGGGHFSGRLTAPLCIVGGICLQILEKRGIKIAAHIYSVKNCKDTAFDPCGVCEKDFDALSLRAFPTLSETAEKQMLEVIEAARLSGDSVGGVIECAVIGLPVGIGEHMFSGLEGRISSILFSIPAVKGVEFGNGFECASLLGSENNDPFYVDNGEIKTRTNNCGGILGGMSNGMPLIFRAAFKPTPSIAKEQDSVDLSTLENTKLIIKGRHDPCVVPRAVPVVEAAAAIAILDAILDAKAE
jgi:chorismate synthase